MNIELTPEFIYEVMKRNFSDNNDFLNSGFTEKIDLLDKFGIKNKDEFQGLIKKNRLAIINYDKEYIKNKTELYRKMEGEEFVESRLKKEFFFSYQGLINIALKIQFPQEYHLFEMARNR